MENQNFLIAGAICFGAVVGWMAKHVLEQASQVDVKWLGSMVGVLVGGAITVFFEPRSHLFAGYCIGLGGAFFLRALFLRPARWIGGILANETERELATQNPPKNAAQQFTPAGKSNSSGS